MNDLNEFIYNLHYETDRAKPIEWEADWADAPLPYKLYRRLPVFPLSAEVPLTLAARPASPAADLRTIGHFLWYVYGMAQVTESGKAPEGSPEAEQTMKMYRRVVASGGALYPNELYLYLKCDGLPAGVYHYDAAHHRLVQLREGDFDTYLGAALGDRCRVSDCFGVLFVSTMFWKNFFKYHNFSYRLQGLDTGVVLGQLTEVGKRFGYSTAVGFQFLDRAVNHLLGLSERQESVYAVIPLSMKPARSWFDAGRPADREVSVSALCRELEELHYDHYVRTKRVAEYPDLIRMNEASRQETAGSFRRMIAENHDPPDEDVGLLLPAVKRLSYDLASVSRKRYSPESDFTLRSISQSELGALFQEASQSFVYVNDLDAAQEESAPRVCLYACLYGIEDLEDGAYRYESDRHSLTPIRKGDHRFRLQMGMSIHNVNLFQVPISAHVGGDAEHLRQVWGFRGYRIQQMEAGMLTQRLLLAAAAHHMGGRPLLGFDVKNADDLYCMPMNRQTSLIQIPVGPLRLRPRLEGSLHH
jgi:SagB-type dehydrogenase family enzyme